MQIDALLAISRIDLRFGLQIIYTSHPRKLQPFLSALLIFDSPMSTEEVLNIRRTIFDPLINDQIEVFTPDKQNKEFSCHEESVSEFIARGAIADTNITAIIIKAAPDTDKSRKREGLRSVISRLRDPETGCPWDLAQDHQSLRPHLLEETYEVLQALDANDSTALCEELGDLLKQIVLLAEIASGDGSFDIDDVENAITDKLIRRHPHVFSDSDAKTPEEVKVNWDAIKEKERAQGTSLIDSVPSILPALAQAHSLDGRVARHLPHHDNSTENIKSISAQLTKFLQSDSKLNSSEFGGFLFSLVHLARSQDINSEDALRVFCSRFAEKFRKLEKVAREKGIPLTDFSRDEIQNFWVK